MTRQKSKTPKKGEMKIEVLNNVKENAVPKKQLDLRGQFNALDPKEQEAVINFFNLHNAAIWIYNSLSTPAVEYVNLSIKLSTEKVKENV